MDTIFCIVGPSGSGKTTLAKVLAAKGYNVIQSYTTRPRRTPDEWGHTFAEMFVDSGDVIAYNKFNDYEYWATKAQYEGQGKSIYVIDPPGDKMLREAVDVPVVTIFLRASDNTLLARMRCERGDESAMKRWSHDIEVFACVKADWVVDADMRPDKIVEHVEGIIESY